MNVLVPAKTLYIVERDPETGDGTVKIRAVYTDGVSNTILEASTFFDTESTIDAADVTAMWEDLDALANPA